MNKAQALNASPADEKSMTSPMHSNTDTRTAGTLTAHCARKTPASRKRELHGLQVSGQNLFPSPWFTKINIEIGVTTGSLVNIKMRNRSQGGRQVAHRKSNIQLRFR